MKSQCLVRLPTCQVPYDTRVPAFARRPFLGAGGGPPGLGRATHLVVSPLQVVVGLPPAEGVPDRAPHAEPRRAPGAQPPRPALGQALGAPQRRAEEQRLPGPRPVVITLESWETAGSSRGI